MNKELYDKATRRWSGKIYQEWRRMPQRIELLNKKIELFKDKNVLEFGSNGGLFCFEIMKYAKSYIGIEKYKPYYEQSLKIKKYIPGDVSFINSTAREYMNKTPITSNAFLSIFVLYHLSDDELLKMEEVLFSKCDVVINMIRDKGKKTLPNNKRKLWIVENLVKFTESSGFNTEVIGNDPCLVVGTK